MRDMLNWLKNTRLFTITLAVIWLFLLYFSYIRSVDTIDQNIYSLARNEAESHFDKDLLYRRWAATEGGVYVPISERIPSNPYLKVPNKDVETTTGEKLTLVNPAYMTRLVHELQLKGNNVKGHITSLNPIRPENKPDEWEKNALKLFEEGSREFHSLENENGKPIFKFMAPLITEQPCLKCHSVQGYKVGDIRGGISISLPYAKFAAIAEKQKSDNLIFYLSLALVGLLAIYLTTVLTEKYKKKLETEVKRIQEKEERQVKRLTEIRLSLSEYASSNKLSDVLTKALDDISELVESSIGFYHFVGEDQKTLSLQQWSSRTLKEFCKAEGKGQHYSIDKAGVWVDCVHQKKPVIHNDYASLEHKKGMPEGHAEVVRQLVVPVMRNGNVVAILGVGNKKTNYTEIDADIVSYLADVTWGIISQKKIEKELEIERRRLESIIEGTNVGTWEWNVQTGETAFNERWAEIIGYTLDELQPININTWGKFAYPDDLMKSSELLEKHFKDELPYYDFECRMKHKNGNWIWVHDRGRVVTWTDDGKPLMMYGTHSDITNRKNIEEQLRGSEERHRLLTENATDVIWTMDMQGKFTYISPSVEKLRGYSVEEVMQQTPEQVLCPGSLKYMLEGLKEATEILQKGGNFPTFRGELEQPCKDGSTVWTEATISGMYKANNEFIGMVGVTRDISERKQFEKQIKVSEERLKLIIENSPVGIFFYDTSRKIHVCNNTFANIIGAPKEKIIGLDMSNLPDKNVVDCTIKTLKGEPAYFEDTYTAITSGKSSFLRAIFTPVFSYDNNILGGIAIVEDFTERKQLEEQIKNYALELEKINEDLVASKSLIEESLYEKNKLVEELIKAKEELEILNSEKDKFFSIIAHDLRSPFQSFLGLTGIIAASINEFTIEQLSTFMNEMNAKANNLFKLLKNLLEWAKMQRDSYAYEPKEMNLYELALQNIVMIESYSKQKEITVINNLTEDTRAYADENMINSVFANLLSNAFKFTRQNGKVEITCRKIENNMIEISVADSGIGMPVYILNNLFKIQEKVGRTGTDGELSSGLGLLLCKDFIEKHNGKIWAESEEGKGSTFKFTLPGV